MKKLNVLPCLGVFLLILCLPVSVSADMVTIETTVVASGSLGGSSYTNELVTITGVGDTDDITSDGTVHLLSFGLQTTVEIDGLGSGLFTDSVQAVVNNNSELAGFGNSSIATGLLFVNAPIFETYDLLSGLGPVSGEAIPVFGIGHETDAGAFRINSVFGDATFSVQIDNVPEPSSSLAIVAVGFLTLIRRSRNSK